MPLTLTEAQEQLDVWLAASRAVATGQNYSIGNRSLSRVDARTIRENIDYWQQKVNDLQGSGSRGRTSYVVPE